MADDGNMGGYSAREMHEATAAAMAKSDGRPAGKSRDHVGPVHGWIQWKGTQVCMDVRCKCGYLGHVDAEFAYYVKCAACGQVYEVNAHVKLTEVGPGDEQPDEGVIAVTDEPDDA